MNGAVAIAGILTILLGVGLALGLLDRKHFDPRWLLIAAGLVLLNDALLTRGYGLLPDYLPGALNWQGKLLALAGTLLFAARFGPRSSGITVAQRPGSLRIAIPVSALYISFFVGVALVFPNGAPTREDIAFQLTLPGIEEEFLYRGILLLALDRAFAGRVRFLGVDWGWGALLSCMLFGLAHAFGYGSDGFSFEPLFFVLTAVPSLVAVWLRYRTGSLLLPVVLHNFGNTITTLV
jgi:membrane protease YdiL (CAAX protease family)